MLEMIIWHFSLQGEDIIEHTNEKVSHVYILVCKEIFSSLPINAKYHLCIPLVNL